MHDEVIVNVGGAAYGGWKSAEATRSIDSMCGSFRVSLMDKWEIRREPVEIKPGDSCQVLIGGDPVITGYIDTVAPSYDDKSHGVEISGRDKTCDLVDCSAEIDGFEVLGLDLAAIARLLAGPFGIAVDVRTDVGNPFKKFDIQVGETAFSCLEKAARRRGVLLTTDGAGTLVLSAKGQFAGAGDALVEGVNIKKAAGNYDCRDRFSEYKTHSQMPAFNWGADDPRHDVVGEARDVNVMRHRPLLLTVECWGDQEDANVRARNECAYRAGKSGRVNISVVGWRQSGGALWEPGLLVAVTSPKLYLNGAVFVISTVRYSFSDSSGTIAEVEMCKPDAYLDCGGGEVEEDPVEL